jgi:hypothetical protein
VRFSIHLAGDQAAAPIFDESARDIRRADAGESSCFDDCSRLCGADESIKQIEDFLLGGHRFKHRPEPWLRALERRSGVFGLQGFAACVDSREYPALFCCGKEISQAQRHDHCARGDKRDGNRLYAGP